jgi:hypothetical protein
LAVSQWASRRRWRRFLSPWAWPSKCTRAPVKG